MELGLNVTVRNNDDPFVKESIEYNYHNYYLCLSNMKWTEAYNWCIAKGGYLATVTSQEEWDIIKQLLAKNGAVSCWLGAKSTSGSWEWVTGEEFSFSDWLTGQPDRAGEKEFYLGNYEGRMMYSYKWNDFSEKSAYIGGFIFERPFLYTITYDLNDGTNAVSKIHLKSHGSDIKIGETAPARTHYEFLGWSTDKNATKAQYKPGDVFNGNEDTVLYAVWKIKHSYQATKTVAPTCTEKGYKVYTCEYCGNTYKGDYVNALGHDYVDTVVAPSVSEEGYTLHECSRCGHSYKDNYTDKVLNCVISLSAKTVKLGSSVTVSASANGGSGEYTYAVYYKKASSSKWSTKQDFSTNNTVKIKPSAAVLYNILVKVKDSHGTVWQNTVDVIVIKNLQNESVISSENIGLGDTINVKAVGTGGLGTYTYAVYYKRESSEKWTLQQGFGDNNSITIKPAKATTYDVCVKVKDERNVVVNKYFKFNVTTPENTSEIASAEIKIGGNIEVSCSATGGAGSYKYAVMYKKKSLTKWSVNQNYSDNSSVVITPASKTTYDVCVKVKDKFENISKKYFEVTVK